MNYLDPITTLTCEGIVCAFCKIAIDFCQCMPRKLGYRSMSERITAQGFVPETETKEAA